MLFRSPASPTAKVTLETASPDELRGFIRKVDARRKQLEAKLLGKAGLGVSVEGELNLP